MSFFMNLLGCFIPRSPAPTIDIEIDIIETPSSIKHNRDKFKSIDIKVEGKAREILTGKKK